MKPKIIHISGKRWFERVNGNTYHSYKIWIDGEHVHYMPFSYGYGDQYAWNAWEWLIKNNYLDPIPEAIKHGGYEAPWHYCREHGIKFVYEVADVNRKKDL